MTQFPSIRLKKYEDKRLRNGHLWIYSNEVDVAKTPLKLLSPGAMVQIENSAGKSLGLAYINPHTLLCGRLLTRDAKQPFDQNCIEQRLMRALALRDMYFAKPFYRLVFGESDGLPGLIVDRYEDVLVAQITTAGMELLKDSVVAALQNVLKPKAILWRNDHSMRAIEGLPVYVEAALGEPPQQTMLEENGVRFCINPWQGQKTGWFYDHRENRAQMARFVQGKRVLDLFSYVGGWGLQAAAFGADKVVAVDSSAAALELLAYNAQLNALDKKVQCIQGDVFEQLKLLISAQESFDVVLLDPPAFIKKRKDSNAGLIAYQRVNELALRLIKKDGLLVSSSCSQHLSKLELQQAILAGGVKLQRDIQIIHQGHQGPDHPIHPAIPETEYLKSLFCRVSKAF